MCAPSIRFVSLGRWRLLPEYSTCALARGATNWVAPRSCRMNTKIFLRASHSIYRLLYSDKSTANEPLPSMSTLVVNLEPPWYACGGTAVLASP